MEQEIQPQPQQPISPVPPDNKSKINPVLVFGVVAVVLIVGVGAYLFVNKSANTPSPSSTALSTQPTNSETPLNTQNNIIPDVRNEIFIATTGDGVVNILIFNPIKNEVIASKKILLDASLSHSSTGAYGSNDSVQYNPKTKEIFFSTQGSSDYDGSCINKDGTCTSRLYKVSLDQTKPTIIFESNSPPINWAVNSFDNSLLLSFLEGKTQTLKKISAQNGKVIFAKDYQIKVNTGLTDFVLSKDGKYTYQASKESVDGKWFYEILRLRKVDNLTGDITEQEIFGGEAVEYETNLSPDNNYLAFYSGAREQAKLYIYEIPTKKLINVQYQGSIGNYNLFWSGDSKKLLHLLKNSLTYYDIPSAKSALITGDPQQTNYVYAWAPSTNYFAYQSQDGGIKIFDLQKNQVIDTQTKAEIEVKGISWY